MQFRLTYDGPLYSTGNDRPQALDRRADHKNAIRLAFHRQLRRLWQVTTFLNTGTSSGPEVLTAPGDDLSHDREHVAARHRLGAWSFIPLVTELLRLQCSLDILFLRDSPPGRVVTSGDLDGRLKTLLDCLSKPTPNQGYLDRDVGEAESPLYVLLEDDSLITGVAVNADQLLDLPPQSERENHVRLVITVTIRPYDTGLDNVAFG